MIGNRTALAAAAFLAIGIAVAGWSAGREVAQVRLADRFVTVKGSAEREVKANLALWPVRFVATGDDLSAVQAKTAADEKAVLAFLERYELSADAVVSRSLDLVDLLAQAYRQGPADQRYILTRTLMIRSPDVERVDRASQNLAELLDQGVTLGGEPGMGSGPNYLFTRLNDVKTEMIAEATAKAREAATQFATDSGATLGGIRRANQGLFQILARDEAPGIMESRQIDKIVRVVSTLDWELVD
ncbi:SIMPL domain-containing protein [Azospirillum sp. Marseille-Q6669]